VTLHMAYDIWREEVVGLGFMFINEDAVESVLTLLHL